MAQLVDWVWQCCARFANGWVVLALLALVVIYFVTYFVPRAKKYRPAQTFDSRAGGFRPSEVDDILAEFDRVGHLQTYLDQARIGDMIFPLIYLAAATTTIVYLSPPGAHLRWLVLLPFAMAIADWIENLCVAAVIGRYRRKQPYGSLPVVLLIAQRVKWLLWGAVLVATIVLAIGWVRRRF